MSTTTLTSEPLLEQPGIARQALDDPALPGLAGALDCERVAQLLVPDRERFPHGAPVLRIRYVRYLPGLGCRISYEAESPGEQGQPRRRLLYGRLDAGPGDGLEGHEREDERYRHGVRRLPAIPMVVRYFPHDAALRQLRRLHTLEALKELVEERLGTGGGDWKVRLARTTAAVVRYKPERRCVVRIALVAHSRAGGTRKRRLALYGHLVAGDGGARTHALLADLAARPGPYGALAIARPWAYDPDRGLLLQEAVPGTPLALHLEREDMKKIMRRLAVRLIHIQRSGARLERRLTVSAQCAEIERSARQLDGLPATRGPAVRAGAAALVAAAPPAGAHPAALLHGDFHHGQVLVRGQRSWIIDFERAAMGDPLADAGAFLAHLALEVEEGRLPALAGRRAIRRFRRAYAATWPEAWDDARLRWQAAAHAYSSALAPLRQLVAGAPRLVAGRLDLARRILAGEVLP